MYAQLCRRLVESAPNFEPPDEPCTFKKLLLKKCRYEFNNRAQIAKQYEAHIAQFAHGEGEAKYFSKKKMLGNLQFLGELCKVGIAHDAVLHKCCERLLYHQDRREDVPSEEEDVECFCHLMKTCGRVLDVPKAKGMMDQYFERLQQLITPFKDTVDGSGRDDYVLSLRVRCLVLDVIELRRQKWIPRRLATPGGKLVAKEERPKTIQQVREEAHRDGCIYLPQQQSLDESGVGVASSVTTSVKLVNPLLDNGPNFFERHNGTNNNDSNGRKVFHGGKKVDQQTAAVSASSNTSSVTGFLVNFPSLSGSGPGTVVEQDRGEDKKRFERRGPIAISPGMSTGATSSKSNGFNGSVSNGVTSSQPMVSSSSSPYSERRFSNSNNYEPAADFGDRFTGNRGSRHRFFNNGNNSRHENEANGFGNNGNNQLQASNYQRYDFSDQFDRYRNGPHRGNGGNRYFKEYQENDSYHRLGRRSIPSPPIGSDQHHPPLLMSEEGFGGRVSSSLFQQQQERNNINNSYNRSNSEAEPNMLFKPRTLGVLPKSAIGPSNSTSGHKAGPQQDQHRSAMVSKVLMGGPEPLIISSKSEKPKKVNGGPNSNTTREEVFAKIDQLIFASDAKMDPEKVAQQWKESNWLPSKMSQTAVNHLLKKIVLSSSPTRESMIKLLALLVADPNVSIHGTHCVEAVAKVWSELRKSEDLEDGVEFVESCALLVLGDKLVSLTDFRELLPESLFLRMLQYLKPLMGEEKMLRSLKNVKLLDQMENESDALQRLEQLGLGFLVSELQIKRELGSLVKDKDSLSDYIENRIDQKVKDGQEFVVTLLQVILEEVYSGCMDRQPESEKAMLSSYECILRPFMVGREKQVLAVYAIQGFWQRRGFPKGMLLKTFVHCYESDLIVEQAFLGWKEDLRDDFPDKGKALFQVNNWLTWLQEAESEDDDDEDDDDVVGVDNSSSRQEE